MVCMIFPGTENFSLKRQELVSCGSSGVLSQLGLWCNTGAGLKYLDRKYYQRENPNLEGQAGASMAARESDWPKVAQLGRR